MAHPSIDAYVNGYSAVDSTRESEYGQPSTLRVDKFLSWLEEYFVRKGSYKITDRGWNELSNPKLRLSTEMQGNPYGSLERVEGKVKSSKKELDCCVKEEIMRYIQEGKADELIRLGYVIPRGSWTDIKDRREIEAAFLQISGYHPTELTREHFKLNGMCGLVKFHNGSTYSILVEAGAVHSIEDTLEHAATGTEGEFDERKLYIWQMKRAPEVYADIRIRIAATKWLAKQVSSPDTHDFNQFIRGVVARAGSIPDTLMEAGYTPRVLYRTKARRQK